jgi:hypothetical protein
MYQLLEAFQHFSSKQLSAFIEAIIVKNMANSVYLSRKFFLIFQICNSINSGNNVLTTR